DRAVLSDRRRLDIPGQAILDGEVVVIKDGRVNFSELQVELSAGIRTGWSSTPSISCTSTAWTCAARRRSSASASSKH
ncbi:MAG: bifunctional non-ous end joining protein LigD, partial [Alphaproteobacteria bacterium]|nr:bifunctional non-ous end joining protein LigD [Alphaproteobacteria bacterium]